MLCYTQHNRLPAFVAVNCIGGNFGSYLSYIFVLPRIAPVHIVGQQKRW